MCMPVRFDAGLIERLLRLICSNRWISGVDMYLSYMSDSGQLMVEYNMYNVLNLWLPSLFHNWYNFRYFLKYNTFSYPDHYHTMPF